jgi:hypothetical protein
VEAYNIGQGFLVEHSLYVKDGRSAGEITVDFLRSKHISYQGSTSYFGGFAFDDKIRAEYPDYLTPYLGELEAVGDGEVKFNMTEGKVSINGTECLFSDIYGAELNKEDSYRLVAGKPTKDQPNPDSVRVPTCNHVGVLVNICGYQS